MSRNLILSSISQLTYSDLSIFLQSVKRTNCDADIVFFAGDTDIETLKFLHDAGVQTPAMDERLIKVPFLARKLNLYKWGFPVMRVYRALFLVFKSLLAMPLKEAKELFGKRYFKICSMRFLYYRDFLKENAQNYDKVLITDVRDVLFQTNPFLGDWGDSLHCFLEDSKHSIASNEWNSRWIKSIGGDLLLNQIGSCPISCAGVTYGSSKVMLEYFEKMCEYLIDTLDKFDLDQGIHNKMIWQNELSSVQLGECNKSAVLTVGLVEDNSLRYNSEGLLINEDDSLIAIVHQYDRKKEVQEKLLAALRIS